MIQISLITRARDADKGPDDVLTPLQPFFKGILQLLRARAIGAQLMANGKTKVDRGYRIAYEVFDPVTFFKELKKRGIQIHERVYEYQKIV